MVGAAGRSSPLDALELVREATTRDGILSVALAYVRSAFEFVALYARRGSSMVVFEASGEGLQGANFASADLALDRPSVLRMVCEARAPYVGPVPAGDPFERAVGEMGRGNLRAVLIYPVVIRNRTVLVFYGDSNGEALAPRQLSDIALVLSQVGPALERVILAHKRRDAGEVPPRPHFVPEIAASPIASVVPVVPEAAREIREAPPIPLGELPPAAPAPPPAIALKKTQATLRWASLPARPEAEPVLHGSAMDGASPRSPEPPPPIQLRLDASELAPLEPEAAASSSATPVDPSADVPAAPNEIALGDWAEQARSAIDETGLQPLDPPLPRPLGVSATPPPPPPPEEEDLEVDLAPEWVDPEVSPELSFADVVRTFLAGRTETRATAERELLSGGSAAAEALAQRFPGPLYVFRVSFDELPEPRKLGPLIGLLGSMGEVAVPALAAVADGAGEERRFWATVLLAKMGHPACLPPLVRRVFDPAPDVAQVARRGLWSHRRQPEYAQALEQIQLQLGSPDPTRVAQAARALGALRHSARRAAAHRAAELASGGGFGGCGQGAARDHAPGLRARTSAAGRPGGRKRKSGRGPPGSSRRWSTSEADIRLAAIGELAGATGQDFGYESDQPAPQRALAVGRWKDWWQNEGRAAA